MTQEAPKFNLLAGLKAKQIQEKAREQEAEKAEAAQAAAAKPKNPMLVRASSPTIAEQTPVVSAVSGTASAVAVVDTPKPSLLAGVKSGAARAEANKQDFAYLFTEIPKDFREVCDRFDAMMTRDTGITDFNIDLARAYVMRIMQDLKNQPELDGLTQDKDIHNILKFIRSTKIQAIEAATVKKEKAANKGTSTRSKKGAMNRFGEVGHLDFGAVPGSLEDLSDFDVDLSL